MKTLSTTTSTILLPVESTTRILELAYLLDQHWAFNQLPYSLLWYSNTSEQTLNYAKSMLEWMGDAIAGEYSTKRDNPFDFKFVLYLIKCRHLKTIMTPRELAKLPSGGRVILCSMLSLDTGYAGDLLRGLGGDPDMLVILTDRAGPETFARILYGEWVKEKSSDEDKVSLDMHVDFTV
jgi:cleavage and polyadenylation specificity factor subunit 2